MGKINTPGRSRIFPFVFFVLDMMEFLILLLLGFWIFLFIKRVQLNIKKTA